MTFIKTDPVLLEEQDDLLMSYLNSDYLSNDSSWPLDDTSPSTPESTSSSEPAQLLSPSSSPAKSSKGFFDQEQVSAPQILHWPMQPYFIPTGAACLQPDLLNSFPFAMPCVDGTSSSAQQPICMANTSASPVSSLHSDFEQTKKRRGRKKRDSSASITQSNTTTPNLKSLAPLRPITTATVDTPPQPIKAEPIQITPSSKATNVEPEVIDQKAAAIAKRQERLIKNRAAALLSRKRKREHLTALEEQKETLTAENTNLKSTIQDLEAENQKLLNENQQLKLALFAKKNEPVKSITNEKTISTKSKVSQSGMVLMIILFSFAILALPTAKNNKLPLMNSHTNVNNPTFQLNRYCDQTNKEDEVMEEKEETFFIKSVSGNELEQSIVTEEEEKESSKIHLYSDQLIQLKQKEGDNTIASKAFSLLCPYEKTDDQRLLQIDMQVVGSRIVQGVFNMIKPKSSSKILERTQMSKRMRRRLAKARVKQRLIKRLA